MAADLVMKRHDTFPALKTTLKQTNQETSLEEKIDLAAAVKVTAILKSPSSSVIEIVCTAWGGGGIKTSTGAKAGQVEMAWGQATLETLGTWTVEFEIEWAESGGVKRYQTVPNEGYRTMEVVADLGTA